MDLKRIRELPASAISKRLEEVTTTLDLAKGHLNYLVNQSAERVQKEIADHHAAIAKHQREIERLHDLLASRQDKIVAQRRSIKSLEEERGYLQHIHKIRKLAEAEALVQRLKAERDAKRR